MLRMILTFLIVVVGLFLTYYFGVMDGRDRPGSSVPLAARSVASPASDATSTAQSQTTPGALGLRLLVEQQRLEKLRDSLVQAQQEPDLGAVTIEAHTESINRRIAGLEQESLRIESERRAIQQNAQIYSQTDRLQQKDTQLVIQRQLQSLASQFSDTQVHLNDAISANRVEDVASLRQQLLGLQSRQDLLQSSLRTAQLEEQRASAAINQQQTVEQAEVRADHADLEMQMADLRADLDYWRAQRQAISPSLKTRRISELQSQIAQQSQRVESLQSQVRDIQ